MMEDLKSLLNDSQVDFDTDKDFEKFTDIGSTSSPRSSNSRGSRTSFREMLNESFETYRRRMMHVFVISKSRNILFSKRTTIAGEACSIGISSPPSPMTRFTKVRLGFMIRYLLSSYRRTIE
jgi:hypothetical protein